MKASELRIGNLVKEKDSVEIVGLNTFKNWEQFNLGEFLSPIPLTITWIIKFGFKKDGLYWYERENNFGFSFIHQTVAFGKSDAIYVKHVLYVHQLQNLFYVLTGEELTAEPARTATG